MQDHDFLEWFFYYGNIRHIRCVCGEFLEDKNEGQYHWPHIKESIPKKSPLTSPYDCAKKNYLKMMEIFAEMEEFHSEEMNDRRWEESQEYLEKAMIRLMDYIQEIEMNI